MNIIIKKVTVVAPPMPAHKGITARVRIPAEGKTELDYMMLRLKFADEAQPVVVDWGDGAKDTLTESPAVRMSHTYAKAGEYEIKISDNVDTVAFTSTDEQVLAYGPCLVSLKATGEKLREVTSSGFLGCVNLRELDCSESKIEVLGIKAFKDCTSLAGVLRFPCVNELKGSGNYQPFECCDGGITEIHFSAANQESILSSLCYQKDPTLGTGTARLIFDP